MLDFNLKLKVKENRRNPGVFQILMDPISLAYGEPSLGLG